MNEEELNRLYELLDASYTANCMLIGNELAGSNEKIALFSSFATGGFFLARNIHHLEEIDQLIKDNIGINLISQVSELLSCYSIIIFSLRSPDKNRGREFFNEFIEIFEMNKNKPKLSLLFDQADHEISTNTISNQAMRFVLITDIIKEVFTTNSVIEWGDIKIPLEFDSSINKDIEDYDQFVNYWIAMEEECFELVLEGIKEFQSDNE
tara:strand:+ start:584 stop:1210 length:627 start_codon:yes stop_codon:yes gene_type:complete